MADYNDPIDWKEERRRRKEEWRAQRDAMRNEAKERRDEMREKLRNTADDWRGRTKGEGIWISHGPGNVAGLVLLLVGGWFLLSNLGIIRPEDVGEFWPVILIAIGVSQLMFWRGGFPPVPGIILTTIGTIFLLRNLDILPYRFWGYAWPVALILVGGAMLVRALDVGGAGPSGPSRLHEWVTFGGVRRRIDSQEFEGGDATAVFGGVRVDLRQASSTRPEVVIHAVALFGGVDLYVGDNWNVSVRGSGIFGGYEDKTIDRPNIDRPNADSPAAGASAEPSPPMTSTRPTLVVSGFAMFGGVTVRN